MIGAIDLERRMSGRDNNFNLIRMLAALAVIVSHAFPITYGKGFPEPLEGLLGRSLGWVAVAIFFFISGLLVTRSFDNNPNIARWCAARGFRIFPGLCASVVFTAYVGGVLVTSLPAADYLASTSTASFVIKNITLVSIQYELPGVFLSNAYPKAVNGSLWTLFYELSWYFTFIVLAVVGTLMGTESRRKFMMCALLIALLVASYVASSGVLSHEDAHRGALGARIGHFVNLGAPFVMGMLAWIYRRRIPLSLLLVLAAWGLTALFYQTWAGFALLIASLGLSVLYLAYGVMGPVLKYNALGDYSYGVYIYAFPVQQAVAMALPEQGWLVNVAITLPVVMLLAVMSWVWVEKPALRVMRSWTSGVGLPVAR